MEGLCRGDEVFRDSLHSDPAIYIFIFFIKKLNNLKRKDAKWVQLPEHGGGDGQKWCGVVTCEPHGLGVAQM